MKVSQTTIALATIFAASAAALAQHDDDVILAVQNGQVITGVFHDSVFEESRLWVIDINSAVTDEPGYEAPSGTFPPSATTGIAVRKALRAWDYNFGHFKSIADETMIITRFSLSVETPPSDPCPGLNPSLQLGVASATGALHVHPWYELTAPAANGMYLLELEFWVNAGFQAIENSKPFWVLFTKQEFDEEVIHEAEEWVIANLIEVPPPCPADLTGSGSVGVPDLLILLGAWGPNPCHPADLVPDGNVGVPDLLALLAAWGPCPQ